jgi:hypothetical protein
MMRWLRFYVAATKKISALKIQQLSTITAGIYRSDQYSGHYKLVAHVP